MQGQNNNKQMLGRTILQDKLGITIGDKSVELQFGDSVFKLSLDERGVPQFPEFVKQQLPTYMPQVVRLKLKAIRTQGIRNGDHIEHTVWCAESTGIGECDCCPGIYTCTGDPETLTCVLCDASSTGEGVSGLEIYGCAECWEVLWTRPKGKFYVCCPETICKDCIETLLDNIDIEFADNAESSKWRFETNRTTCSETQIVKAVSASLS